LRRRLNRGRTFRTGERPPAVTALAVAVAGLGIVALAAPLGAAEQPLQRVGVLLTLAGGLEVLHGVRRAEPTALRRAVTSGFITVLMGLAVVNAPFIAGTALILFLAASFALDGLGHAIAAWRATARREQLIASVAGVGDLSVAALFLATRHMSATWLVAVAAALRMCGVAWTIAVTPVHAADDAGRTVIDDLGLGDRPEAVALLEQVVAEERARAPSDRRWTLAFVATLFAIHITRMQPDGSLLGYVAPTIAVLGDMLLAILFTLAIVAPVVLSLRRSTRRVERGVWRWYLALGPQGTGWRHRIAKGWLRYRLRIGMRLREARYSVPAALARSLAAGLPVAAVIAASVPVWGMSWFFDTENWASGMWNSWAESRTDSWRAAMVREVTKGAPGDAAAFSVNPPGATSGNFSFIVIGDTGEGDASQHVLRDQLLSVAGRDDVRFVVVSSDVVYPNGSMIDYEAKFWLPFKGVKKPVYAIPGNHDWYDALEAFLATFVEAGPARAAMHARTEADLRVTSSTSARIDGLIAEAERLRRAYEVPTGFQRGPFFDIQTDRFALIAIDTGIVKRIDREQRAWLEASLERARGKTTMAVVGHPFYAGGYDMTDGHDDFAELKRLLISRGVTIMMAGDTHDLEYYADPPAAPAPAVHYFVNGGGGAYMSFGTALAWPAQPPTAAWAYYPDRAAVAGKISSRTPWWKRPAWWWTTEFGAWPFSAEWLSAAFDYNVAPFFQSFVEVRVEPSSNRIRLWPYGVNGRLHWRDLAHSPLSSSSDDDEQAFVEWIVPMR
jgi:uncharacterized membrane protein HdeD (DUF308 family)/3',5'-cyclic AMP phosphodiesterase CpdA